MMKATCITEGCAEHGVAKDMEVELLPGEMVMCGGCFQPCELTEDS